MRANSQAHARTTSMGALALNMSALIFIVASAEIGERAEGTDRLQRNQFENGQPSHIITNFATW
jgi:hypothetical protein